MRPRRGFTIIELLTVFIIAGIVMAITLPKLSGLADMNGVRAAKQQLSSYIVVARASGIRRGQRSQFRIAAGSLSVLVDSSGSFVKIRPDLALATTQKVTITTGGATAADSIMFNTRGFSSNLTGTHVYVITRGTAKDSICVSKLGLIARRCGA